MFKFKSVFPIVMGLLTAIVLTTIGFNVIALANTSDIDDCSKVVIPKNTEINTHLNKEKGLITVSWLDENTAVDKKVTMLYNDPNCSISAKSVISHALVTDKNSQIQICQSFREIVQNNITEIRGQKVNLFAAKQYITEWCN